MRGNAFFGESQRQKLRTMVSCVTTSEEIGARILRVRNELGLSQKAMAEMAGIAIRTWQGIEAGRNVPSGETLLRFQPLGYNAGWILTGLGPKSADAKPEATTADLITYIQFLPEIGKAVEKAYRASNGRISELDLLGEAARWLEVTKDLVSDIGDKEQLHSLLPWIEIQVKKEIANANAGKGKRVGSDS